MAMRDPNEWAESLLTCDLLEGDNEPDRGYLAIVIREAQEDGSRAEREKFDVERRAGVLLSKEIDRFLREREETRSICSGLRGQVAALTERAERAEGQRDDAANRAMQAVESLNANVMARRNAHPRGCCDWSCDLCAPLLELDEKGNG